MASFPGPYAALRRDCFIEGVASSQFRVYRAHHRPTGLVAEFIYQQRTKLPPFDHIVDALLGALLVKLHVRRREQGEDPIHAPPAA